MNVGIVGNGAFGALVDRRGRVVWCCLDGFGGDPIFNSLLNNDSEEGGWFDVQIENLAKTEQKYIPNSAILITTLISRNNDVLQIKDFAPKFFQHDRTFNPSQLIRTVTRVRGDPIATIRVRPSFEYNAAEGYQTRGSHHVRFCGPNGTLRLTTNAPISFLIEESPFLVHEPICLVFGPDETFAHSIATTSKEYEERTLKFWKNWSANLCLPVDYQDFLVRSAISLQLVFSEEIGGFVESLTMSSGDGRVFNVPEVCIGVSVLQNFGFPLRRLLEFLKQIVFSAENLQAVYDSRGQAKSARFELDSLAGGRLWAGLPWPLISPDGEMGSLLIVAFSIGFFDVRLKDICSAKLFEKMEQWGESAFLSFQEAKQSFLLNWPKQALPGCSALSLLGDDPTEPGVSTMGSILAWTAADRLGRIAEHCHWVEKAKVWRARATEMRHEILKFAKCASSGALVSRWGGEASSAPALLRVSELGFVASTDPIWIQTVASYEATANPHGSLVHLLWYAEALRSCGRVSEARNLFHAICATSNECGLLGESVDLETANLYGNMPHTPTLLGVLRVGSRLSRDWRSI